MDSSSDEIAGLVTNLGVIVSAKQEICVTLRFVCGISTELIPPLLEDIIQLIVPLENPMGKGVGSRRNF